DTFGVASRNIQIQQGTNRILIELPGGNDAQRVRTLLQGSAKLEFYDGHDNVQVYPLSVYINNILADYFRSATSETSAQAVTNDSTTQDSSASDENLLANLGAATKDSTDTAAVSAELAASNPLFSILNPATYIDQNGQPNLSPGAMVGIANLKDTARVNDYLNRPEVQANIPGNLKFL